MPLQIDIAKEPEQALQRAKRISRDMKNSFGKIYAYYVFSIITGAFVPTFLLKHIAEKVSLPFTLAFSNTPGILRQINYKEVTTLGMMTSIVCSGKVAISVGILSYAEQVQFSVLADTCVGADPKDIRNCLQ